MTNLLVKSLVLFNPKPPFCELFDYLFTLSLETSGPSYCIDVLYFSGYLIFEKLSHLLQPTVLKAHDRIPVWDQQISECFIWGYNNLDILWERITHILQFLFGLHEHLGKMFLGFVILFVQLCHQRTLCTFETFSEALPFTPTVDDVTDELLDFEAPTFNIISDLWNCLVYLFDFMSGMLTFFYFIFFVSPLRTDSLVAASTFVFFCVPLIHAIGTEQFVVIYTVEDKLIVMLVTSNNSCRVVAAIHHLVELLHFC